MMMRTNPHSKVPLLYSYSRRWKCLFILFLTCAGLFELRLKNQTNRRVNFREEENERHRSKGETTRRVRHTQGEYGSLADTSAIIKRSKPFKLKELSYEEEEQLRKQRMEERMRRGKEEHQEPNIKHHHHEVNNSNDQQQEREKEIVEHVDSLNKNSI